MHAATAQKIAVVTGGAAGLGQAAARRFAGEGTRWLLFDCDSEGLDRAARDLEGAAVAAGDVTHPRDVEAINAARDTHGDGGMSAV